MRFCLKIRGRLPNGGVEHQPTPGPRRPDADYVFAGCTGKAEQKWNAPTGLKPAPLKAIQQR